MEIYAGPFSIINLVPENSLLIASWSTDSKNLDESGVKFEIGRVLNYTKEYNIQNIIVDTRNYYFTDNVRIQSWINRTYMPQIMDCGVMKYALIVNSEVKDKYADFEESETVLPVVEYFADLENAKKWIES